MACCFFNSRAMPWLSGGDRRRSITGKLRSLLCECLLGFRQFWLVGSRDIAHLVPAAGNSFCPAEHSTRVMVAEPKAGCTCSHSRVYPDPNSRIPT